MTSDVHLAVIGIDGLRWDAITPEHAPTLTELIATGYSSATTLWDATTAPTLSGPGWATNLTGVGPETHGVLTNVWGASSAIADHPDFLSRLGTADPTLTTFAAVTWAPIVDGSAGPPLIGPEVRDRSVSSGDVGTVAAVLERWSRVTAPNATFVHLDAVDEAGHAHGAASDAYRGAVAEVDGYVGQLCRTIAQRPTAERWSIIVTTDHGHTDAGGHGGHTDPERSSFIVKTGPGIARSTPASPARNVDVAADVLATFGLPVPPELDGRPLVTETSGD